ncbi:MAG: hypothetical protein N2Z80_05700 [Hydrogenothermaceae bacterium]|nr:hypothetical protein [Hydrogenothermaceae bacterium]
MKRLLNNPVFIIVLLTLLMFLPIIVLLFDRYMLKTDNFMLFFAELGIITVGVSSGVLMFYFMSRK